MTIFDTQSTTWKQGRAERLTWEDGDLNFQPSAAIKSAVPVDWKPVSAVTVYDLMLQNFPPEALTWVKGISWYGPVDIPFSDIDTDAIGTWAASTEPARVSEFVGELKTGKPVDPGISVEEPDGNDGIKVIDGHHRALASEEAGVPFRTYIGVVDSNGGPWDQTHSYQLHQGSDPANKNEAWETEARGAHGEWGSGTGSSDTATSMAVALNSGKSVGNSPSSQSLKDGISQWIGLGSPLDPAAADRAAKMLESAVDNAPHNAPVLYRGMSSSLSNLDSLINAKPGFRFKTGMSSWTSDHGVANDFAEVGMKPYGVKSVVLQLESGSRSLNISKNAGPYDSQAEWISKGTYEVTESSQVDDTEDTTTTILTVRQVS